jgi:hypothetical protein
MADDPRFSSPPPPVPPFLIVESEFDLDLAILPKLGGFPVGLLINFNVVHLRDGIKRVYPYGCRQLDEGTIQGPKNLHKEEKRNRRRTCPNTRPERRLTGAIPERLREAAPSGSKTVQRAFSTWLERDLPGTVFPSVRLIAAPRPTPPAQNVRLCRRRRARSGRKL